MNFNTYTHIQEKQKVYAGQLEIAQVSNLQYKSKETKHFTADANVHWKCSHYNTRNKEHLLQMDFMPLSAVEWMPTLVYDVSEDHQNGRRGIREWYIIHLLR